VELVTFLQTISPFSDETLEGPPLRRHLHACGVRQRRATAVTAVEPGRLAAEEEFGEPLDLVADAVVLVTQRLSNESLYLDLKAADPGFPVYRIGDCVSPRIPAEAIFDGHRLAREIDGEDPAVPLPYLRERLVLSREDVTPL
jgi:dimethylamine/trimethylamine dehydrogenase